MRRSRISDSSGRGARPRRAPSRQPPPLAGSVAWRHVAAATGTQHRSLPPPPAPPGRWAKTSSLMRQSCATSLRQQASPPMTWCSRSGPAPATSRAISSPRARRCATRQRELVWRRACPLLQLAGSAWAALALGPGQFAAGGPRASQIQQHTWAWQPRAAAEQVEATAPPPSRARACCPVHPPRRA
jgi:hypothetical protein